MMIFEIDYFAVDLQQNWLYVKIAMSSCFSLPTSNITIEPKCFLIVDQDEYLLQLQYKLSIICVIK
jgi:hypothetical protein